MAVHHPRSTLTHKGSAAKRSRRETSRVQTFPRKEVIDKMSAPTMQQVGPPQQNKWTVREGRAAHGVSPWHTWLKMMLAMVLIAAIVAVVVLSVSPAANMQPDKASVPKDTGIMHASMVNPVTPLLYDADELGDRAADGAVYCGVSE